MDNNQKEIFETIKQILNILENNFKYTFNKKLKFEEVFELVKDLNTLIDNFQESVKTCGNIVVKRYIPLLDMLIKIDDNQQRIVEYLKYLKNAYKLGARVSLEHYMIYREWEEPEKEKFFEPRYNILQGYIHYLQELECNPNFRTLIFNAPSGYGKLLANDTPILTKDGWKKHGDLKVGDYVISPKGEFIRVNLVHPKRLANCKITFDDGEEILCHNQHEWQVFDRLARKEKQVETTYLIEHLYEKSGRPRFLLPQRGIVQGEYKKLPVDPYTYGLWLGDGSTSQGRITQNNNDAFILDTIPYDISNVYNGTSENVKTYSVKGLATDLHKLGLCYQKHKEEKFIHDSYLTASIEQRLQLLAGVIDTDGYLDQSKQRYIITTCGEKLKNDIVSLLYTFGWRTCVTTVKPITSTSGIVGKLNTYYIGFSPDIKIPCKIKRNQIQRLHKQRRISFKKIELIDPVEGNCITVDGGLYLAGKTLKMTHNTYPKKISEAWSFGNDNTGAMLSLCSNDDVVKSGSRTVIDEIKSEPFGEVFPKMKWSEDDKKYFLKETDEKWKLKTCKLPFSYYAKTTQANVVGSRASKSIHIDDLYPDYKEAMNQALNVYYYNKSITVWEKRFVQHLIPKVCITGTLWASGDYIDLKIQQLKREYKFVKHPKYPYTWISEDESCAIIQVPALDYETGESTCPEIKTTAELLKEKANMEEYLWETNFQQIPTNPESLSFSYDKIRTYDNIPTTDFIGAYSVIDATRKSGKDFFAMPIFKKVQNDTICDYYLKDALFTRTATKDMYDEIVDKIVEHHIILLIIESNVTSELKQALDKRLSAMGITFCEIIEKYNTIPKPTRIENEKHLIKKQLVFPQKGMYGANTHIGKFIDNLTTYNATGTNANDDAPDSLALFCSEVIEENSQPQIAEPLPFIRQFF